MTNGMTSYEQQRELRIAANKRKLEALGVLEAKAQLDDARNAAQAAKAPKRVRKRQESRPQLGEPRRSARERPEVNYREETGSFNDRIPGEKGERKVKYISRDEIDPKLLSSPKQRSAVDSGKGVRIQGGRVYDSRFGVTCHWCRQKTVEHKVTCTSETCGGGSRLPVSFCKMCLKNRHGEDVDQAEKSGKWVCPCCRGSCGEGCTTCCNCGPCRKKASMQPTGQIIKEARDTGFDNVHDYLIHQQTGEPAERIASRKSGFGWASWMEEEPNTSLNQQAADDAQQPQGTTATRQQMLSDTLPSVKVQNLHTGKTPTVLSRRTDRKQRVLLAMGLAPIPVCA